MLRNEIIGADNELPAVESSLARISVRDNNPQAAKDDQSRDELLAEMRHQQASNTSFRRACEEALSETHYKQTGQRIKNVRATDDSAAFVGDVNVSGHDIKGDQDISDISASNRSVAAVGRIGNVDFSNWRTSSRK